MHPQHFALCDGDGGSVGGGGGNDDGGGGCGSDILSPRMIPSS